MIDEEITSSMDENQIHVVADDADSSDALVDFENSPVRRPSPDEAFIALEARWLDTSKKMTAAIIQLLLLKRLRDLASKKETIWCNLVQKRIPPYLKYVTTYMQVHVTYAWF